MNVKNIVGKSLTSTCYIGLLLMFAYTSLFFEVLVSGNVQLIDMFNKVQGTWSGFIVNIGLLLMLLIDYVYNKSYIPRWSFLFSILAFGSLVLIYYFAGHAKVATNFNQPFNWPWLGVTLYALFTVYLCIVKWLSIPHTEDDMPIIEIYSK